MTIDLPVRGALVEVRSQSWRIERVRRTGDAVRLDVRGRDRRATFLLPFDRLDRVRLHQRPRRAGRREVRRRLATVVAAPATYRVPLSAGPASIDIMPFQLEPALALRADARRVLIADEVGLGKTVQAGLVIAELTRRVPNARALVLTPASLRDQWIGELDERFGLPVRTADGPGLSSVVADGAVGDNPWSRAGIWLASLDFIKQPHVLASLPARAWDLVVIDEAHDACGDTDRHAASRMLAGQARRVLLLTATPHSGDETRFARLQALGCLAGRDDPLVIFRRTRRRLGLRESRHVRWHRVRPGKAESRLMEALLAFELQVLSRHDDEAGRETATLLLSVFRKRALSTAAALRATLSRRLRWLEARDGRQPDWRQPALPLSEDDFRADEAGALLGASGMDEAHERSWVRRLLTMAARAADDDSKVCRLTQLLTRASEPAIVFTEFRDSLDAIRRTVGATRVVAVLHGGQPAVERRRELARFQTGAATVLIATDVAGQGLNLHERCHWVINLELPWNPVRLEQRAGRIDRIGQRHTAHVTSLVSRFDAESGLLTRLARRVLTAREAVGEDALGAGLPSEAAVRAAMWRSRAAAPVRPARTPAGLNPGRWTRQARVAARRILLGRRLAQWPSAARHLASGADSSPIAVRPASAGWQGLWRLHAAAGPALLIFRVPLLDGLGDVLENHVVGVRVPAAALDGSLREAVLVAREVANVGAAARRTRLAHLVLGESSRDLALDEALARRLVRRADPGLVQAGLFDGRTRRAADVADQSVLEIARAMADRVTEAGLRARVVAGLPELVVAIGIEP